MKKILCILIIGLCLTGCSNTNEYDHYKYNEKEAFEYTVQRVKNEYSHIKELNYLGIADDKSMICFEAIYDEEFSTEYKAIVILHLIDGSFFISETTINDPLTYHHKTFN